MKSNLALINSIGFTNNAQKAWYCANVLKSVLVSAVAQPVVTAVAAVVGKRAIPAYTGFAGIAAKSARENTTGYATGSLFPGRDAVAAVPASGGYAAVVAIPAIAPSPAYAIGVAVPGYPAIGARAAQLEVVPVTAVAAVSVPAITAITGYESMVICSATATKCTVEAYLPYDESPKLYGKSAKSVAGVKEITAPTVVADHWYDTNASAVPAALTTIQPTIEKMLYEAAQALVVSDPANNTIETVYTPISGKTITCHKLMLNLPATAYGVTGESIQLNKFVDPVVVFNVGDHLTVPTINNTAFGWVVLGDGNTLTQVVSIDMPFPVPCTLQSTFGGAVVIDPVLALSKAIAVNTFIKNILISNNSGNTAALARIDTISNDPMFQQPVVGGLWFFDGAGNQIGYNYYPNQNDSHNYALDWFEFLHLGLGVFHNVDGINYLELFAK